MKKLFLLVVLAASGIAKAQTFIGKTEKEIKVFAAEKTYIDQPGGGHDTLGIHTCCSPMRKYRSIIIMSS